MATSLNEVIFPGLFCSGAAHTCSCCGCYHLSYPRSLCLKLEEETTRNHILSGVLPEHSLCCWANELDHWLQWWTVKFSDAYCGMAGYVAHGKGCSYKISSRIKGRKSLTCGLTYGHVYSHHPFACTDYNSRRAEESDFDMAMRCSVPFDHSFHITYFPLGLTYAF